MWLVESKDPKIEAEKEISQIVLLAISTFNFLLEQYFAVKKTFIRTKTQQKAQLSRLKKWASPFNDDMPIDQIGVNEILTIARPMWHKHFPQLQKVPTGITEIFRHAQIELIIDIAPIPTSLEIIKIELSKAQHQPKNIYFKN